MNSLPFNFTFGDYRLRVDFTRDQQDKPTSERWCWLWTGHYWKILFPIEQADFSEQDLMHATASHLGKTD